jgi:hypothetical protein
MNIAMKNIITAACIFVSVSAWAQIPKGTSTVGGLVGFSYDKQTQPSAFGKSTTTTTMAYIQPGYGIFVIDNLCVGANLNVLVSGSTFKSPYYGNNELKSTSRGLTVGPFVRYYLPATEKLYGVFGAGYSWGQSKAEGEYFDVEDDLVTVTYKTGTSVFDVSAGIAYFLNPNAALEATIGYTSNRAKDRDTDRVTKTQTYGLGVGLRIFLRKS